jgi:hypothetical protein
MYFRHDKQQVSRNAFGCVVVCRVDPDVFCVDTFRMLSLAERIIRSMINLPSNLVELRSKLVLLVELRSDQMYCYYAFSVHCCTCQTSKITLQFFGRGKQIPMASNGNAFHH